MALGTPPIGEHPLGGMDENVYIFPPSGDLSFSQFAPDRSSSSPSDAPPGFSLTLSTVAPNVTLWVNPPSSGASGGFTPAGVFTSSQDRSPVVAVIISLYSDDLDLEKFLLLSSGSFGGNAFVSGLGQYDPRLYIPIEVGMNISSEDYGVPIRGVPRSGNLEFALDDSMWLYLGYNWNGRNFGIYEGQSGDTLIDLANTYSGQVSNLRFDTNERKISVSITDRSVIFDKPLIEDFYDDSALVNLRGRPYPYLRGECYSCEPILEDEPTQLYRLSNDQTIEILEVRVGGVPWAFDSGYPPGAGLWGYGLSMGTFNLGSETLGEDVRVDVRGGGIYTHMRLLREIITHFGGQVDEAGSSVFEKATPQAIGIYLRDQVNILDIVDQVTFSASGFWEFSQPYGRFKVQLLEMPNSSSVGRHSPMISLNESNVLNLSMTEILPPAKKITVEYKRNWQPMGDHILASVLDDEHERQKSPGIAHIAYSNPEIDDTESRSVEVPLIRTFYSASITAAIEVGQNFAALWDREKRIYEVSCWLEQIPELYDTVYVDYDMVVGYFRIHSIVRQIGSGMVTLRLWGNKNIRVASP